MSKPWTQQERDCGHTGASASPTACLRSAWSQSSLSPPKAAPACAVCGREVSAKNTSGKCIACAAKTRRPPTKRAPLVGSCSECGKGITAKSKTGLCQPCGTRRNNTLPETRKKRVIGWRKRLAKPGEREKLAKQVRRNHEKAMTDPEIYAKFSERGKWLIENVISKPEIQAKIKASRKRAGQKLSDYRLSWCPPQYRELHKENQRKHHMTGAESRAYIEKLAATEELELRAARHPCFDAVIDFMRRKTAVFDHGPDKEKRYRVGLVDLTAGELLKRAEFNGYRYPCYPQACAPFVPLDHESGDGKIAA